MTKQSKQLAFIFPGQGSQSVGMLTGLAAAFPDIKLTFDRASLVLGRDMWELITNGPESELNQTENTQPAMLAAGVVLWELWCKHSSIRPAWIAGHSLGEYTALVCSGALFFEDAVKLVASRAKYMQEAVPNGQGAMAAILGLEDAQVIQLCESVANNEVLSAVNFNSPGQVVVAGHVRAVERAIDAAKQAGAKRAVLLPVSVPSHCALMSKAADKLEENLNAITFGSPKIQLIHNVDVECHSAPELIKNVLKEQLYSPVRWVETIKKMSDNGVTHFVECGPGKVLTGLGKRIVKEAQHLSIHDPETLHNVLGEIND